jgi:hypothetical protein
MKKKITNENKREPFRVKEHKMWDEKHPGVTQKIYVKIIPPEYIIVKFMNNLYAKIWKCFSGDSSHWEMGGNYQKLSNWKLWKEAFTS